MKVLDSSSTSGRSTTQYTIEGYLLSGDKTYHIVTYTTLHSQVMSEYNNAQHLVSSQQMSQQAMEPLMDTLSSLIDTLSEQRYNAAYDLAIVEMTIDRLPGDCGTHHHEHGDNQQQDKQQQQQQQQENDHDNEMFDPKSFNPLAMSPSWVLRRWRATCNPMIGRVVIFSIHVYQAWSFQVHASGSDVINAEAVNGRTKILLQIINNITQQQMGFIWKLAGVSAADKDNDLGWNATGVDDSRCQLQNQVALTATGAMRASKTDVTVVHTLVSCSSVGVVGVAAVNVLCTKEAVGGISSINGIYSWTTFGHELQHQVGAEHPFGEDESKIGLSGGLMDYNNIRLSKNDPNPGRYGFNQETDSKGVKTNTCLGIQNALEKTFGSLPDSTCYTFAPRTVLEDYCGNGIVEPWEECDNSNVCCNKCKLSTGATCPSGNAECCVSCTAQAPKRCSLPGDSTIKTGVCSVGGECLPMLCGELSSGWSGNSCPDSTFFPVSKADKCGYICPTEGCTSGYASSRTNFESGSPCVDSFGVAGICVDDVPFNVNQRDVPNTATCITKDKLAYSWKYTVVAQCDCAKNLDLIDAYTCLNQAGGVVASSFCSSLTKPTPNTCCCNPPCEQDFVAVGGDPNASFEVAYIGSAVIAMVVAIFA